MIAKNILKRLVLSLLICMGISFIYWVASEQTLSNEGKQYYFVLLILNFGVCIFSGLLSLTALLNTKASVVSNEAYSLLAFIGLPALFFITLLLMFFINRNDSETLQDFLQPGLPSLAHCIILILQFFMFRSWYEKHIKTS
jgi:hypothetical protein